MSLRAVLPSLCALALCFTPAAAEQAGLIRSAKSGPWSAPATWEGGKVPAAGAKVQVKTGHVVVYDAHSDAVVRSVHVAGTLTFSRDKDTLLNVGLVKVQAGDDAGEDGFDCEAHVAETKGPRAALELGSPDAPIPAGRSARVRLHFVEGLNKQSCPAIVCCGGRMDFHGAPLSRAWVRLGKTAKAGEATVSLGEAVTGWKAGDRVVVTATSRAYKRGGPLSEVRTVKAIDGTSVTLDKPLSYEHLGEGDFRGEVANLSRNVVVESAAPEGERGHTMYHRYSAGSIGYAEFAHLGKPNVLGRYSLHYHLCGDTMRGSSVVGASIHDSGNRWLTIHGTNYLVVRDCVGYGSLGHGFFLEDGTEVYNVLDRNLAVGAKRGKPLPRQVLSFDGNEGAGFWWANSLNTFTRNVAAECDLYGFRYEATPSSRSKLVLPVLQPDGTRKATDVRTLPFVRFDGNEVHSSAGLYGVNLGEGVARVGPDARHPFVVRDLKIWDVHYAFRPQVPSLLVERLRIHKAAYGIYHPNYDGHVYRDVVISQTNTEPFNRGHDDVSVQHGALTVDGLTFDGVRSGGMPLVQISDDNPSGKAVTHLRNVKTTNWTGGREKALVNLGGGPRPQPKTAKGVTVYLHDWYGKGRHAEVVSTRSPEYKAEPKKFRADAPLTGDESRAAEVSGVEFPNLLDPVDDLPPATVVTGVRVAKGTAVVTGTTSDGGTVTKVVVNGKEAKAVEGNYARWEAVLEGVRAGETKVTAHALDAAGNVEKRPHEVVVRVP